MRNRLSQIICLTTLVLIAASAGPRAQTASVDAAAAQQVPSAVLTPVPRVIWFSGAFRPADKRPVASVETVTVAVYREREGGDAVWQETQTVRVDADGRYSLLMGSTLADGMPLEVFTSGEPRWIGITVDRPGEAEQPRVHLASVPYALKAADTEALGGKPASAYLLADQKSPRASKHSTEAAAPSSAGTPGWLGVFVDSANLGNSALYQNGTNIGKGTVAPLDAFHVQFSDANGGATGYAVQNMSGTNTAYSGMLFYDQNGALGQFQGFNNFTHEYRVNNIATSGSINFMIGSSSKLLVANSGNIGLGVAAPASKLDVAGDIHLNGTLNVKGTPILRVVGGLNSSVGLGVDTLLSAAPGDLNAAIGYQALKSGTTASANVAVGAFALLNATSGGLNTAVGLDALASTTTGNNNIGIGLDAGSDFGSGQSSNIAIGSAGTPADSGTIRVGTPGTHTTYFAAGVRGVTTASGDAIPVVIDSNGQLGTLSSSRRFKEDVHDMGDASRGLMQLRPVTFRYKAPFGDGSKPMQYGLIAEEVAEVYPDLVAHSADGQIETVKYQVLDAMLLNEVQQQQADIRALRAQIRAVIQQNQDIQQQNKALQQRLAALEAALAGR